MSNNADATSSKSYCFLVAGDFGTVIVHNSDKKNVADDICSSDPKRPLPADVDMKNLEFTSHAGYALLLFHFIYIYEYYIRNVFCQYYTSLWSSMCKMKALLSYSFQ